MNTHAQLFAKPEIGMKVEHWTSILYGKSASQYSDEAGLRFDTVVPGDWGIISRGPKNTLSRAAGH
jgi:hypothetical protein